MAQSVFFIGWLTGSWLWGTIADKIGRKKVYFINAACMVLSGLGFALAPGYKIFVFFRFLSGASSAGLLLSSYVLSMEIVDTSIRSFVGFLGAAFFSLAYPFLALLAYFVHNWRWLSVVISLLGLGYSHSGGIYCIARNIKFWWALNLAIRSHIAIEIWLVVW